MKSKLTIYSLCFSMFVFAQQGTVLTDSISNQELKEISISTTNKFNSAISKPLGSVDEYLQQSNLVNMVRRGAYASEPFVNGMSTERSVITIDGMRIYAACTDKMDPVTSYIETTNLQKATFASGQVASTTGSTIAGGINLVRNKGNFGVKALNGSAFTGLETNNKQHVFGASLNYSEPKFFADIDVTYRKAGNYKAGKKQEILFSQFKKINTAATLGYKIKKHKQIEASFIYDYASNVGYPALPMDVLFAKAYIASLVYKHHHINDVFKNWETKIYYNDITHIMDDSKRPDVPIRMDMPGWSRTAGGYSTLIGTKNNHNFKININAHQNYSLAEMTMFSNISTQKDMFMLTWPGVTTKYFDINIEDDYNISDKFSVKALIGLAHHTNQLKNDFGFKSMQIFYPEIAKNKSRLLKRFSLTGLYKHKHLAIGFTSGYGERAPSISEGYGFYLFNSFDKYDYIGNPNLKNEKAFSITSNINYTASKWAAKFTASAFYIKDYIIGKPNYNLSAMTINAAGVKIYEQIDYATIYNIALEFNYNFLRYLSFKNKLVYTRGIGKDRINLPTMQPFTYQLALHYSKQDYDAVLELKGAAKQHKVNSLFGEKPLPSYVVLNASLGKSFYFSNKQLVVKVGAENILDKKYTTFSDWNRLPQMGKNVFVNTIINF